MAELCLECMHRIDERNDPESMYVMSSGLQLCEGCGKMKQLVISYKDKNTISLVSWLFIFCFYITSLLCNIFRRLLQKKR